MKKRTDMPMVGTGVFLCKGNKILLGKRKGSHGSGFYSLPGGHLEKGETMAQAAIREVEEETGIVCEHPVFLTAVDEFFPEENLQYVTAYLVAMCEENEVAVNTEPEKCEGWDWYSLEDLPEPLYGGVVKGIDALRQQEYVDKTIKDLKYQIESDRRWANFNPNNMKG